MHAANGPYLSMALFCERVAQDAENRLTLTGVTTWTPGLLVAEGSVSGYLAGAP